MHYAPNFELQPGSAPGLGEADRTMLRLWAAVFRQGLQDWAAEDSGKRLRANLPDNYQPGDSIKWFESNTRAVGSFCWLCDLFEIHPDTARSMARLKKRELVRGVGQRF